MSPVPAAKGNMLLLLLGFLIRLRKRESATVDHPKAHQALKQFTEPQKG